MSSPPTITSRPSRGPLGVSPLASPPPGHACHALALALAAKMTLSDSGPGRTDLEVEDGRDQGERGGLDAPGESGSRVPEALMAKEEDLDDDEMAPDEESGSSEDEEASPAAKEGAVTATTAAASALEGPQGRRTLLSLKTNSLKRSIALPRNPFSARGSILAGAKKSKSSKGAESAPANKDSPDLEVAAEEPVGEPVKPSSSSSTFAAATTANVRNLISRMVSQLNSRSSKSGKCGEVSEERLQEWRRRLEEGKVPGVIGIRNHGNTCFINAILQCLSFTDIVAEYFVLDQYKSDLRRRRRRPYVASFHKRTGGGNRGEVTEQLATLLKSLWSLQYDPEISIRFKSLVEKHASQYKGSSQHDAQEFLLWLLDQVHEDLNVANKKKYKVLKSGGGASPVRSDEQLASEALANYMRCNNSFVMEVFQAQFRSSLTCHTCERQSNTFDPFLCVSLPIPQKQLLPVFVTVLYIDQTPRQVRLGLTVGAHETVADLRRVLARDTGIPAGQILLTEIGKLGFERTLLDGQPVSVLKDAKAPLFCIEVPRQRHPTEDDGAYAVLAWVNVFKEGPREERFGSPYTIQVSRETLYADMQKLLLKEMAPILHDDILISNQKVPLFKVRVLDGFEEGGAAGASKAKAANGTSSTSPTYLDPNVDLPMYAEAVEQAINLCSVEAGGGPAHVKLILEWDMPAKTQVVDDDSDVIEEHASVKEVQKSPEEATVVSLQECFDLYTSAEKLSLQDAWFCPSCNRKQEVVKRMGLWSVPDVLVVHLKRFRQSSSSTNKLSTMVEFPLEGFDMAPNVSRSAKHAEGTAASTAPPDSQANTSNEEGASAAAAGNTIAAPAHDGVGSTMKMLNAFSMWKNPKRFVIPGSRGGGGGGGTGVPAEDQVYDLYAVCNHLGSDLQGGHYTASCRNPTDGQWYNFDDVNTRSISEKEVVTQDAYILFYQKQSLSSYSSASSSSSGSSNQEHWVFRMPDFAYKKKSGIVKVPSATSSPSKSSAKKKPASEGGGGDKKSASSAMSSSSPASSSSSSSPFQRNSAKYATLPAKRTTEEPAAEDCEPDRHSDIVEQTGNGDEEEDEDEDVTVTDEIGRSEAAAGEGAEGREGSPARSEDEDGISRPIDKNDVD